MRGTYDDEDNFHMDYYFPYCIGSDFSTNAEVEIIKQSDRECYQGLCDDLRLGVNLVFFLQNMMEFLQKRDREKKYHIYTGARLSGLSTEGMILLPIKQSEKVASAARTNNERDHLMAAAREGDEEAIEHLTLEDMDTYSMISEELARRIFSPSSRPISCPKELRVTNIRSLEISSLTADTIITFPWRRLWC